MSLQTEVKNIWRRFNYSIASSQPSLHSAVYQNSISLVYDYTRKPGDRSPVGVNRVGTLDNEKWPSRVAR